MSGREITDPRNEPYYRSELDRREFFKRLGCGVVVLFLADAALAQETGGKSRREREHAQPADIGAWLHINEAGVITVFTGKAELGQNIRTSLTQAVAEELRVSPDAIQMVMADTQLTPWDPGTFGSRSMPDMAAQLHKVGAAAREALLDLAVVSLKTERALLILAEGKISKESGESVTFGELAKDHKLVKLVSDQSPVTPPGEWKVAGTSIPKVNARDFVTGKHKYASDFKLPGMLHGKVLRPTTFGAMLSNMDTKPATSIFGVRVVHEGNFVGVTAPDVFTAARAADAIRIEWDSNPAPLSNAGLFDYLKQNVTDDQGTGGNFLHNAISLDPGFAAADEKSHQTYSVAYIAHVPLEPRAAVAEWDGGKLTVWTGTQRPFGVRNDLAETLGIPEEHVRVIVPDTGSAYGGKNRNEAATEAARLARATGRPVKVVWTRQEEFTWAYFRPAGIMEVNAGVRKDGALTVWEFHNYNSGNAGIATPYEVPLHRTLFHTTRYPLQQGYYRGLAATANHFARESHMDELAHAIKMDPLEFRLKNLKDARLRDVLTTAAKAFGWEGRKAAVGRGFGLACGTEKGSYLATCVEVLTDRASGSVKVVRAVSAFDCGAIVNPDQLKNQVEGAMMMGLGGALFEAIEFDSGMITNPHLADYRVPRFSDAPKIEVVLIDRKDVPSAGAGETPIIGMAPAIGNAIFNATGIRLRSLPMVPEGLKG